MNYLANLSMVTLMACYQTVLAGLWPVTCSYSLHCQCLSMSDLLWVNRLSCKHSLITHFSPLPLPQVSLRCQETLSSTGRQLRYGWYSYKPCMWDKKISQIGGIELPSLRLIVEVWPSLLWQNVLYHNSSRCQENSLSPPTLWCHCESDWSMWSCWLNV